MSPAADETEIGGSQRSFSPTLWTMVLRAKDSDDPVGRKALEKLIGTYWKPLYFLVRREGHDPEAAKDIVQGFFVVLLRRDSLRTVDPAMGRFRTFLIRAIKHYLADEHARRNAQKRGGGLGVLSLDCRQAETEFRPELASGEDPDRYFDREWALEVIARALATLRSRYEEAGKSQEFEALRLHLAVGGETPPSHSELAGQLGTSENNVKNLLYQARKAFREVILGEIRSYTASEEEASGELADLFRAVSTVSR